MNPLKGKKLKFNARLILPITSIYLFKIKIYIQKQYRIDYYLQQLPKSISIRLFHHPATCICLLRFVLNR